MKDIYSKYFLETKIASKGEIFTLLAVYKDKIKIITRHYNIGILPVTEGEYIIM